MLPSVKKFAIGIGGAFGRGVMVCRTGEHFTGPWGAPAMYALEGGNFGFQFGAQATDFVLLVVNPRGAESLMGSKIKLGADASAAAGPKGRTAAAATDIAMRAEILSYSRSRGLFAGFLWKARPCGRTMAPMRSFTGRKLTAKEILREGKVSVPAAAHLLDAELQKASPKNRSDPKSLQ